MTKKKENTIEITKNEFEGENLETILRDPLTEEELIEAIKKNKEIIKFLMIIQMFIDDFGEDDFIVYEDYKQIESTIEAKGRTKQIKDLKQRVIDNLSKEYLKKLLAYYVKMLDTETKSLINEIIRGFSLLDTNDIQEENLQELKKQLNEDKEYSKKYILLAFKLRRMTLDSINEERLQHTIDTISSEDEIEKQLVKPLKMKNFYSNIFSNYHTIISYKLFEMTDTTTPEEWEAIQKQLEEQWEALEEEQKERENLSKLATEYQEERQKLISKEQDQQIEEQIQLFETEDFEEDIPFVIDEDTKEAQLKRQRLFYKAMKKDFEENHDFYPEEQQQFEDKLKKKFEKIEAFILSYEDISKLRYNDILKLLFKENSRAYEILKDKEIEESYQEIVESEKGLKELEEDIFEKYEPISKKDKQNKLITTEKIVPQLFLQGNKITEQFKAFEEGKIQKVAFDLSGDSEDNFIVEVIMNQYPIEFTTGTFQTLESLMTIQNYFENIQGKVTNIPFSTKDIIFLNKGGKVSKYTPKEIEETNQEILSLMSAIGQIDITEYMKKYNEQRTDEEKISNEAIKKISALQNFVYLKGINVEYKDNKIPNDTIWYFTDKEPIAIFSFIKLTKRFTLLPLKMDSYLTDNQINNEITRAMKGIVANLRYYKSQTKKKQKIYQSYYYEGSIIKDENGKDIPNPKTEIFKPEEAMIHIKKKDIVGKWKFQAIRTIDSLAYEMKFDNERPINTEKQWKNKMEKPRFIDSIVEYLRQAKEDNIIEDFQLYTEKEEVIKEENYITEGQQRKKKQREKIKGTSTKPKKQKKNPPIYKIGIIINQDQ